MSAISTVAPAAPTSAFKRLLLRFPLVSYFGLAYLLTWLCILPMALSSSENGLGILPFTVPDVVLLLLFVVPCFGPALAAIIVTGAESGKAGVGQLLGRILQWRVGFGWYLAAIFGSLLIWLVGFSLFLGVTPFTNVANNLPLVLSTFVPFVLLGLVIPSLGEEPGWRGFALPRLQARYGPLVGTLILGLLHGLWHLPSFFTTFAGPFSLGNFAAFVLAIVGASFIWTWLYNKTGGSLLLAILVHSGFNAASSVLSLNQIIPHDLANVGWASAIVGSTWLNVIAFGLAAVLVIVSTRGRLGYRAAPEIEQRGQAQVMASQSAH